MTKKFTVKEMAMVGVLTALVFVASQIKIPLPTIVGNTRLHLGNVMCLLSGFLLGPVAGGFAAGFGSAFYDLTDPLYITTTPFTFVFKFAMAWVCGKIARSGYGYDFKWNRNVFAAVVGAVLYVILYLSKNFIEGFFFLRLEMQTVLIDLVQKGIVSLVNGIIAAVASVPLAVAVQSALKRTGFYRSA